MWTNWKSHQRWPLPHQSKIRALLNLIYMRKISEPMEKWDEIPKQSSKQESSDGNWRKWIRIIWRGIDLVPPNAASTSLNCSQPTAPQPSRLRFYSCYVLFGVRHRRNAAYVRRCVNMNATRTFMRIHRIETVVSVHSCVWNVVRSLCNALLLLVRLFFGRSPSTFIHSRSNPITPRTNVFVRRIRCCAPFQCEVLVDLSSGCMCSSCCRLRLVRNIHSARIVVQIEVFHPLMRFIRSFVRFFYTHRSIDWKKFR